MLTTSSKSEEGTQCKRIVVLGNEYIRHKMPGKPASHGTYHIADRANNTMCGIKKNDRSQICTNRCRNLIITHV